MFLMWKVNFPQPLRVRSFLILLWLAKTDPFSLGRGTERLVNAEHRQAQGVRYVNTRRTMSARWPLCERWARTKRSGERKERTVSALWSQGERIVRAQWMHGYMGKMNVSETVVALWHELGLKNKILSFYM